MRLWLFFSFYLFLNSHLFSTEPFIDEIWKDGAPTPFLRQLLDADSRVKIGHKTLTLECVLEITEKAWSSEAPIVDPNVMTILQNSALTKPPKPTREDYDTVVVFGGSCSDIINRITYLKSLNFQTPMGIIMLGSDRQLSKGSKLTEN